MSVHQNGPAEQSDDIMARADAVLRRRPPPAEATAPPDDDNVVQHPASKLAHALAHAAAHRKVFPVKANGKTPAVKGWRAWATLDEAKLREHWARHPDDNIGLPTDGLTVVDVDVSKGANGNHTILDFELAGLELPATYTVQTASGGKHIVMSTGVPVGNSVKKLGAGLDVRGDGGFVVGAGSTIDGKAYVVVDSAPIALAPSWLVERCGRRRPDRSVAPPMAAVVVDAERARARAIR